VFWDKALQAGDSFDTVLAEQLASAASVIVLWSPNSVESDWVRDEAQQAKQRGVLLPVLIQDVSLPLGFGRTQTADLTDWNGEAGHPGLIELDQAISRTVGRRPPAGDPPPMRGPMPSAATDAANAQRSINVNPMIAAAILIVAAVGVVLIIVMWNSGSAPEDAAAINTPVATSIGPAPTVPAATPATTTTQGTTTTAAPPTTVEPGELAVLESASGEPLLPSAAGMVRVTDDQPVIGFADYATVSEPNRYRPERALGEAADFHVDERSTSNAFYREWLRFEAGNDSEEWRSRAPQAWIDNSEGGFPTFVEGTQNEPVTGVSIDNARAYCAYVNKRLVTEIEWELAAASGAFVPDTVEVQSWVDMPEEYGPVEPGSVVIRGSFGSEEYDVQYRTIAPDGPVMRTFAGIRCASDTVRAERVVAAAGQVSYEDDFSDLNTGWPTTKPDGTFSVGYHPTDVYHVETERENVQLMVVGPQPAPADSTVTSSVELRKPADGLGQFRYGIVARSSEEGYLILTIWPEVDGETRYVNWCLAQSSNPWLGPNERTAARESTSFTSTCPDRLGEGRLEVETFSNRLGLALQGAQPAVTIDDREVELDPAISIDLPAGNFGFYMESFGESRTAHMHYDGLLVTSN
jgi:hypothetical protein